MTSEQLKAAYSEPSKVAEYAQAAADLGLGAAEERLITRYFQPADALLNAGCGAGRVSFGLWELDYRQVLGVDFARPMIEAARLLAAKLEYGTPFRVAGLSRLQLEDGVFDGILWLACGVADLPDAPAQIGVLRELRRVARSGAPLLVAAPLSWPETQLRALLAAAGWTWEESWSRDEVAGETAAFDRLYPNCRYAMARGVRAPGLPAG